MQKIKLSIYIYTHKIGLIRSGKKIPNKIFLQLFMNNYALNIYDLSFFNCTQSKNKCIYIVTSFITKYKKSHISKVLFWFFFRERERASKSDHMHQLRRVFKVK